MKNGEDRKKVAVAVYAKINGNVRETVQMAFYKAVLLRLSNYIDDGVYGVAVDLPDAPCYRSYGDEAVLFEVSRCFELLPSEYKSVFFASVRARRYNIKNVRENAFACEGGAKGALDALLSGRDESALILGREICGAEYLYFSAYDGLLEAGGLLTLIKRAEKMGGNIFPVIRSTENEHGKNNAEKIKSDVKRGKHRQKRCISELEGLYTLGNGRKKGGFYVKSAEVRCINNVSKIENERKMSANNISEIKIERKFWHKEGFSRYLYRSAVAASRLIFAMIENGLYVLGGITEKAELLLAIIAMRMFGFLGDEETVDLSEALFNKIEEELCLGARSKEVGKQLFLFTVISEMYRKLAFFSPSYLLLKLRVKGCVEFLEHGLKTKSAEYDNIYLKLCYKCAVIDCESVGRRTKLINAVFSDGDKVTFFGNPDFGNTEEMLCLLVNAVNGCFAENIRVAALGIPIIKARQSILDRCDGVNEPPFRVNAEKAEGASVTQRISEIVAQNGAYAVRERLFSTGASVSLTPFLAYIEQLMRTKNAHYNKTVVKICYKTSFDTDMLRGLIKAAKTFENVSLFIICDNVYVFNKLRKRVSGAKAVLVSDTKLCDEIRREADIIRRIDENTTLAELMSEVREKNGETAR